MFDRERASWQRYFIAILAVVLAIGTRALIDPFLGSRFTLVTVLFAVIPAVWYGGRGPALLALVLSLLGTCYLFLPPRYSIFISDPIDHVGLVVYVVLGVGLVVLGETVHRAYRRIEADRQELASAKQRLEVEAAHLQQSQKRLVESEERYRLVNRATNDVIWDWDLTTNAILWNDSVETMFGYSLDEIPPVIDWWYDNIHPEERDRVPGDGSRFFFTVRFARQPAPALRNQPSTPPLTDLDDPAPRSLRVLLAEDTPANQKLVQYLLGRRGHTVQIVENGQDAVDLMRQQPYDLVLMDVQMPVMDGFQATSAIRRLEEPAKARIPIVAMTAHAMRGDQERCLDAGMDGYLAKPINGRELVDLVERLAAERPVVEQRD